MHDRKPARSISEKQLQIFKKRIAHLGVLDQSFDDGFVYDLQSCPIVEIKRIVSAELAKLDRPVTGDLLQYLNFTF